jgi:ribosomal protein S18 acetylase RimI-like enzyme
MKGIQVVALTSGKGEACAEILATLPQWFGIPASNAAYARDVESMPVFAAVADGKFAGFIALHRHTPYATEIHVMGVKPALHRQGIGRALVDAAERDARIAGARFLTVKTRGPSKPDPNYARTRAFYEGLGFLAIEEFPLLWDAENPALMMIKPLG